MFDLLIIHWLSDIDWGYLKETIYGNDDVTPVNLEQLRFVHISNNTSPKILESQADFYHRFGILLSKEEVYLNLSFEVSIMFKNLKFISI